MRRIAAAVALLAAAPAPAADVDTQQWTTLIVQGPVGGRAVALVEVQPRLTDDVSRLGQLILRGGVGLTLASGVTLLAGYHYQRNDDDRGLTHEHRAWQQVQAPLWRGGGGRTLVTRWRLEERTFVGAGDLGWRLRGRLTLALPLTGPGSFGPLLHSEGFVTFNDTDWGQQRGLDQWRNFIGVSMPLTRLLSLEAGYMNQYLWRRQGDRSNHIANITLSWRL